LQSNKIKEIGLKRAKIDDLLLNNANINRYKSKTMYVSPLLGLLQQIVNIIGDNKVI